MRIAYLTGEYPRATDTFIQREVTALRAKGIEIHTFSVRRTGSEHIVGPEQLSEQQQTYYILPPNPLKLLRAFLMCLLRSPSRFLKGIKLAWDTHQPGIRGTLYQVFYFVEGCILAEEIRSRKIEHLHNHFANSSCSVSLLAATLGGFTFSFTLHGPAIFFEPKLWRIDEKIRRALFVSCISYYSRSQGMVFASWESWSKMHVIHCGVDPNQFKQVTHSEEGKSLLYVGRLAAVKGLPILLDSLKELKTKYPNLILTVIGDGSDRAQLEEKTRENGLEKNVQFVGYQSQQAVREYLQKTDIFVMSSFAEGVPVVLMEAMASGVPVVATQIAGVSELVENEKSGYLIPPGNPKPLIEAIDKLLINPDLRAQMGQKGRQKVEEEFNINLETERLYQVFTCTLQKKSVAIRPTLNKALIETTSTQATVPNSTDHL